MREWIKSNICAIVKCGKTNNYQRIVDIYYRNKISGREAVGRCMEAEERKPFIADTAVEGFSFAFE